MDIHKKISASKLILLCFILLSVFVWKKVEAADLPVRGVMWSSTIGWISASSTTPSPAYGLTVHDDGRITGQAWSNNIGWVSFDASDAQMCTGSAGVPGVRYSLDTRPAYKGYISGYARAIAGTNEQGWDGCIGFGVAGNSTTRPRYTYNAATGVGTFSGAAWGDVNIGWLDISGLTASPLEVISGSCITPAPPTGIACPNQQTPLSQNTTWTSNGPNLSDCPINPICKYYTIASSNSCTGTMDGTKCLGTNEAPSTPTAWMFVADCPTDPATNICKYTDGGDDGDDGGDGGDISCKPYNLIGDVISYANVGQKVVWKSTGGAGSWGGDGVGSCTQSTSCETKYSTIGKKTVTLGGVQCTVVINGQNGTELPIINDPNFKEF